MRITTDLICVALGFIMGCMPGVGTILTALCMGPLVSFFNEKLASRSFSKTLPEASSSSSSTGSSLR